ncbi:hypothetical protein GCM10009111_13070 [Colwellia asteriadis]|uniref:Uncharacterized protein n=1 Tax=Colwellia asteriadis TaxID=517723 RepID=A0ABP3WFJ4_9GAMM
MKKFNLAALPLAVAGIFASTSAFAGTTGCFETYPVAADGAVVDFTTLFTQAACNDVAGNRYAGLQANDPIGIAYELTNVNADGENQYVIDYDNTDLAINVATGLDQHIVYIPTSDIPPGTLIEFTLSGSNARFAGNNDIIHLVKEDGAGGFEAISSTDGDVDGTNTITFITKSGLQIGAGTRLVLSRTSVGAADAALEPIGIDVGNSQCTTAESQSSVSIQVTQAVTDGGTGYTIIGAETVPEVIAEISPQFYALHGGTTAEGLVNAESSDIAGTAVVARTEFVYDSTTPDDNLIVQQQQVIYKTAFYNRAPLLDRNHTLHADDDLDTKFVVGTNPGSDVEMGLYNAQNLTANAEAALTQQEELEAATLWADFGLTEADAPVYDTDAEDVFTPRVDVSVETNPFNAPVADHVLKNALYNEMFYVVTNERTADSDTKIMNFNYVVDTHYTLDFSDASLLDHCAQEKKTHEIGVNGAVLKVPYVTSASGNFVRITNEHDESAEVTFDIFGESVNGTVENRKMTALSLGTVPAQSSVVYFVPKLVEEAEAAGYLGQDGGYAEGDLGANFKSSSTRHTVTFTVTAPRDSVHGVAVQKVIGSPADRVMPVLDQNDWSQ